MSEHRIHDDYEQYIQEFEELVQTQYRDSLVLAHLVEAEEEDFTRRRWEASFCNRLRDFVVDSGDASTGALSLARALEEAEPRKRGGKILVVWLGPLAREWIRSNASKLREFFDGRYGKYIKAGEFQHGEGEEVVSDRSVCEV